jgi:hypothetical protein
MAIKNIHWNHVVGIYLAIAGVLLIVSLIDVPFARPMFITSAILFGAFLPIIVGYFIMCGLLRGRL